MQSSGTRQVQAVVNLCISVVLSAKKGYATCNKEHNPWVPAAPEHCRWAKNSAVYRNVHGTSGIGGQEVYARPRDCLSSAGEFEYVEDRSWNVNVGV